MSISEFINMTSTLVGGTSILLVLWFIYDAQPNRENDVTKRRIKISYALISLAVGFYCMSLSALSNEYAPEPNPKKLFAKLLYWIYENFGHLGIAVFWFAIASGIVYLSVTIRSSKFTQGR